MARRSPLNPRYQKNTGPAGKTRRSASAAKPKREAGGQAAAAPAKKKQGRPSWREVLAAGPSTPEMKRWRRIWWVAIGVALACALAAVLVPAVKTNRPLALALTVVYLIALGLAFYIDMGIIRKLRARATAEAKAAEKKGRSGP